MELYRSCDENMCVPQSISMLLDASSVPPWAARMMRATSMGTLRKPLDWRLPRHLPCDFIVVVGACTCRNTLPALRESRWPSLAEVVEVVVSILGSALATGLAVVQGLAASACLVVAALLMDDAQAACGL